MGAEAVFLNDFLADVFRTFALENFFHIVVVVAYVADFVS